jgi:hypothetical protein
MMGLRDKVDGSCGTSEFMNDAAQTDGAETEAWQREILIKFS